MKLYKNFNVSKNHKKSIILIGNFDGVHIGHQKLFKLANNYKKKFQLNIGVVTFEPMPKMFFDKKIKNFRLSDISQKNKILKSIGVDFLITKKFDKNFSNIKSNFFIKEFLSKKDSIVIDDICSSISTLINKNYHLSGGSKFPVLVFYSLYKIFLKEFKRYEECELVELGSHTASDLNSKSSGDIEVTKENIIYEAVELKLNVLIDLNIINRAIKKIHTYNPKRYFILSSKFNYHDRIEIDKKIKKLREQHGCQLIIDDPISYLKSCLRLIQDPENFLNTFSQLVVEDTELKIIHKENWKKILKKIS